MKKGMLSFLGIGIILLVSGCRVQRTDGGKLKDLSFELVEEENVPEELKKEIAKQKEKSFKITYTDKGVLYIAKGYGTKETSGYSIRVKSCYESGNAVYVHTTLLGPSKEEKVVRKPTNPQIILRLDASDKIVVFE